MGIPDATGVPALRVKSLSRTYVRGGLWQNRSRVDAVHDVSLEIARGTTLALIGQSGSGKSTVARCVTRLEQPDNGEIWVNGTDIARLTAHPLFAVRAQIQMVFQDAVEAMNRRFSAAEVIEEPLQIRGIGGQERRGIAQDLMKQVGLRPEWMDRSIRHFSGGQRQRIALARALTVRPAILVLDEPFTGLDLSTQAQIANLLLDLQRTHALTYLMISHDLALVARMADSVAVMHGGRVVESGPTRQVVDNPQHPATKQIVDASSVLASQFESETGESA